MSRRRWLIITGVAVVAVAAAVALAFAVHSGASPAAGARGFGRPGAVGPLGLRAGARPVIGRLILWVVVIGLVALVVAAVVRGGRQPAHAVVSPGLAELDLRYARGEIDRDDYLRRRADLGGPPVPTPA